MKTLKKAALTILLVSVSSIAFSQLKLGTNPTSIQKSSILELESAKQGLLFPRITDTTGINALNPPDGMVVFFTPTKQLLIRSNAAWQPVSTATSLTNSIGNYWSLAGNTGINPSTDFIGTADNFSLRFRTNNLQRVYIDSATGNVAIGSIATTGDKLYVTGGALTAISGSSAGANGIYGTTSAINNNAIVGTTTATNSNGVYGNSVTGYGVLGNSTGSMGVYGTSTGNIGVYGSSSGYIGVYGNSSVNSGVYGITTASGAAAVVGYTTAAGSTGVHGESASGSALFGIASTAAANPLKLIGVQTGTASDSILTITGGVVKKLAFSTVTTAAFGVPYVYSLNNSLGVGTNSLIATSTGTANVSYGDNALHINTTGYNNTATGVGSLFDNTTGYNNTAIGTSALFPNGTGIGNTALGYNAGYTDGTISTPATLSNATAIGGFAQVTASNSLVLGGTGLYAVNVGIGTTAPAYKLDVNGTGRFYGANPLTLLGVQAGTSTSADSLLTISNGLVRKIPVSTYLAPIDAAADGVTKGIATFTAADFNSAAGVIGIDYADGQAASGSVKGFLTAADWNTFNNKAGATSISGTTNYISKFTSASVIGNSTLQDDGTLISTTAANGLLSTGIFGVGGGATVSGMGTRLVWLPSKAAFRAGHVGAAMWDNANIGNYSFSFGQDNIASGQSSAAWGVNSTASAGGSTAFGSGSTASGSVSTAFGLNSIASGNYSNAFGYSSTASGNYSNAIGYGTIASGSNSTALGSLVSTNLKNGSFIIGDANPVLTSNDANNQMMMRFTGGYKFFTDAMGTTTGIQLTPAGLVKYNANYGSAYDARTLVDKNYVDSVAIKITTSGITATSPVTYSNGLIGIMQATTSTNGYLNSTDWNTFNNKANGGNYLPLAGGTLTGALNGTSAAFSSTATSNGFIKSGGTASQFLKADGSVDANTYLTSAAAGAYLPLAGGTLSGALNGTSATFTGITIAKNSGVSTITFPSGSNDPGFISHEESTSNTGIMRFSVSDDNDANDYFAFGNTASGTFAPTFKILANGAGTFSSTATSTGFIKSGGTASQFLKADGSIDGNTYLTTVAAGAYLPLAGGTLTGALGGTSANFSGNVVAATNTTITANYIYLNTAVTDDGLIIGSGRSSDALIVGNKASGNGYLIALDYAGTNKMHVDYNGAATFSNSITASSLIKSGGTASQFLKADGSIDGNTYLTTGGAGAYLPLAGGTLTGAITVLGNQGTGIATAASNLGAIQVQGLNAGTAAFMSFHRPGAFAAYFGLDADNQWKVGGWSYGASAYTLLHSGNYNSYSPTLAGAGASGTWGINITGNAGTAGSASSLTGLASVNGSDGWFRSTGPAGWYNSTYAVGIYAVDAGNVRTYNGANFISGGTVSGTNLSGTNTGDQNLSSYATHRGEGTNYVDYSRYVYNNGAYSGSGWIEPSDLGVRYANSAATATSATNFMSTSHAGSYWLVNNWDGSYWSITSNHGAPAKVGYADNAGAVAWGNVSGRPSMDYLPLVGGALTGGLGIGVNGAPNDPYGAMSVTQPGSQNYSYYGMTRQGVVGLGIGVMTDNRIFIGNTQNGSGSSALLNGTPWLAIDGAGGTFSGNVTAYSDIRLKKNIHTLPRVSESLRKIDAVEFDRTDINSHQLGFIAQNVQKYFPDLVIADKDSMAKLSLNYQAMTAPLLKGWQEHDTIIIQQQEKIDGLIKEVEMLKASMEELKKLIINKK